MIHTAGVNPTSGFGVDNGKTYLLANRSPYPPAPIATVEYTNQTVGLINNRLTIKETMGGEPMCEMVTISGTYDQYAIDFQVDTSGWNPLSATPPQ